MDTLQFHRSRPAERRNDMQAGISPERERDVLVREPDQVAVAGAFGSSSDEARVYDLVWKRTVASQMKDAKGVRTQVRIEAPTAEQGTATFTTSGSGK